MVLENLKLEKSAEMVQQAIVEQNWVEDKIKLIWCKSLPKLKLNLERTTLQC